MIQFMPMRLLEATRNRVLLSFFPAPIAFGTNSTNADAGAWKCARYTLLFEKLFICHILSIISLAFPAKPVVSNFFFFFEAYIALVEPAESCRPFA